MGYKDETDLENYVIDSLKQEKLLKNHKKEQEISKIQETINGLQVLIGQKQMLPVRAADEHQQKAHRGNQNRTG